MMVVVLLVVVREAVGTMSGSGLTESGVPIVGGMLGSTKDSTSAIDSVC